MKGTTKIQCSGRDCEWFVDDGDGTGNPGIGCAPGIPTCSAFELHEAEISDFHDKHLARATQKIREIIAKIPPDPRGRQVSCLKTKTGLLLAWVDHGKKGKGSAKRVTSQDKPAKVAKALGLKTK